VLSCIVAWRSIRFSCIRLNSILRSSGFGVWVEMILFLVRGFLEIHTCKIRSGFLFYKILSQRILQLIAWNSLRFQDFGSKDLGPRPPSLEFTATSNLFLNGMPFLPCFIVYIVLPQRYFISMPWYILRYLDIVVVTVFVSFYSAYVLFLAFGMLCRCAASCLVLPLLFDCEPLCLSRLCPS